MAAAVVCTVTLFALGAPRVALAETGKPTVGEVAALVTIVSAEELPDSGEGVVQLVLAGVTGRGDAYIRIGATVDGVRMTQQTVARCSYEKAKRTPSACKVRFVWDMVKRNGDIPITVKVGNRTLTTSVTVTTILPPPRADWQQEMLELLNAARAKVGSPPLTRCSALDKVAQARADELIADYTRPPAVSYVERAQATGYYGFYSAQTFWGLVRRSTWAAARIHFWLLGGDDTRLITAHSTVHVGFGRAGDFIGDPDSFDDTMFTSAVLTYGVGGNC